MRPISRSIRTALVRFKNSSRPFCTFREEETRVGVGVWWDLESCKLPGKTLSFNMYDRIADTLGANGIDGPIHHIKAYGDMARIPKAQQETLCSSHVQLLHVPLPSSSGLELEHDLHSWANEILLPQHLFLIAGDGDYSPLLHRLRRKNFNILLASPITAPRVLWRAATIVWQWNSLLDGQNLAGKHVNHPPDGDGPDSLFYGHYDGPLEEDPFELAPDAKKPQMSTTKS